MTKATTSQILEAVSEKMASGQGFTRKDNVDHFESSVQVLGATYRVKVAWPDGAEAHEINPEIEEA
jgi:hypothetical protein